MPADNQEQTTGQDRAEITADPHQWEQINDDGSPITDTRYRRTGEHEYTFTGSGLKIDHTPRGHEFGYNNLSVISDKETAAERGRKGNEVLKEKRNARESMLMLLNLKATKTQAKKVVSDIYKGTDKDPDFDAQDLPDHLTRYDLLNLAMLTVGTLGSDKAATYVRDTAGDKPTDKAEITGTITDGDRALLDKLRTRMHEQQPADAAEMDQTCRPELH